MALLIAEEFDWRGALEGSTGGGLPLVLSGRDSIVAGPNAFTLDTTKMRTGSSCLYVDGVNYNSNVIIGIGSQQNRWCSFYVKFLAFPSSGNTQCFFGDRMAPTGTFGMDLRITSGGKIEFWSGVVGGVATFVIDSFATLSLNTWHKIQVYLLGTGTLDVYIDDVSDIVETSSYVGGNIRYGVCCPFEASDAPVGAAGFQMLVDDFSVDSTTRHAGDLRCATLTPTSDIQRGSWTGGAGGTTNLWDAVNNLPPIGTATETNLTQIESADGSGNNTTDEYVAGFPAWNSSLPNVASLIEVRCYIQTGEDVSTGAKTGSFAITQNPNQGAYTTITQFGPAAGGALGTHPTNWMPYQSVVDASAVDVTTAPRIAVRKTDTGTRVASVELIKLEVLYRENPPTSFSQVKNQTALRRASRW